MPLARSAGCDVDKHIGELIERGRGEAGDGLLGELLPGRLEPRYEGSPLIAELRHMVTRPSVGDGRRTTKPAGSSLRTLPVMVGGSHPLDTAS